VKTPERHGEVQCSHADRQGASFGILMIMIRNQGMLKKMPLIFHREQERNNGRRVHQSAVSKKDDQVQCAS
jgi:hypothetical protein